MQALLPQLGLPLIDSASVAGSTEIVIEDPAPIAAPLPGHAIVPADGRGGDGMSGTVPVPVIDLDEDTEADAADAGPAALVAAASERPNWQVARMSPQQLGALKRSDYQDMGAAQAATVGGRASAALSTALQRLAAANAQKRLLKLQIVRAERAEKKQKSSEDTGLTLELTTKGEGSRRLTATAALALGIRKNLAHIAAGDFGALLMTDISAATVLRAEVKTGASVAASMKDFTSEMLTVLRGEPSSQDVQPTVELHDLSQNEEPWSLLFIAVRADATNSSIWRREKLHVTEAQVALVTDTVKNFPADHTKFLKVRRCLSGAQHRVHHIGSQTICMLSLDYTQHETRHVCLWASVPVRTQT